MKLLILQSLFLIQSLTGVSLFLQSFEFLTLDKDLSSQGIWRAKDLPKSVVGFLFNDQVFSKILFLRMVLAFLSIFTFYFPFWITLFLWLTGILLILRFEGPFQGGADSMTILTLTVLLICYAFPERAVVVKGALIYLGFQVGLSYFISGFVKVRIKEWRDGSALQTFLQTSVVEPSYMTRKILENANLAKVLSIGVIVFELSFPVVFINPNVCLTWMALALVFHAANVIFFGLNRFFWTWLAAYPALYFIVAIIRA